MKVVAVIGSPHGMEMATGSILKSLLEGVESAGAKTQVFSLSKQSISPCMGCRVCGSLGRCVLHDDFNQINNALLEADGIVLATPNYFHNVSTQMKAFIDHCSVLCHGQMLKGKYGAAVVSSGGPMFEPVEKYLFDIFQMFGVWSVGSVSAASPQMQDEDENARVMQEATDLGKQMVKAIQNREIFPEQEEGLRTAFDSMRMMIQLNQDEWTFEYDYWKKNHGLSDDSI
jgi:multimeric flavodoxin WrbA